MPHVFSDSPGKRIVREKWNTPLLRHLYENHGCVYRYFGLPGPEIIDIKLWRDMINEVVAFEIPATGRSDERSNINNLRLNLEKTGIPNTTYYGSFEEVILRGADLEGQEYYQKNVITLYNLDFCGEIGSKIISSNGEKLYRFEAIRQVIRNQAECYNRFKNQEYFIILLTVRNQMNSSILQEQINTCRPLYQEFIECCEVANPIREGNGSLIGTHAWAIKTIIHAIFNESLRGNNIKALFFPLVKYEGVRAKTKKKSFIRSPMLHLMIFCGFQPQSSVVGVSFPENALLTASLNACSDSLALAPEPGEQDAVELSPVEYFERLKNMIF